MFRVPFGGHGILWIRPKTGTLAFTETELSTVYGHGETGLLFFKYFIIKTGLLSNVI